jgi:hypothetical protein
VRAATKPSPRPTEVKRAPQTFKISANVPGTRLLSEVDRHEGGSQLGRVVFGIAEKFRQRPVRILSPTQPVQPEGACQVLAARTRKVSGPQMFRNQGGIRSTFQRAFFKRTFVGSNPTCPANQSCLCGQCPTVRKGPTFREVSPTRCVP